MARCAVLIDAGYFSQITKKFFGLARVDMLKFSNNLCQGNYRVITYYYDCMPYQSGNPTREEKVRYTNRQRFFTALNRLERFEVRLGRLQKRDESFQQKGVDVQFVLDLSRLCREGAVDKVIIVSGDSDFVPAVVEANELGVVTQNVYYNYPQEFSFHLRDACTDTKKITQELIDASLR